MRRRIQLVAKRTLPAPAIDGFRRAVNGLRSFERERTKTIFDNAAPMPAFLSVETLAALQRTYPAAPPYGYDPTSLRRRGMQRAKEILSQPGAPQARTFLEVGCLDGMVSSALKRHGKIVTAIDNRSDGFDERAISEGVRLLEMDAATMAFDDQSFEFIFSYNTFEHFSDPEVVLKEMIRVVRKGGYIFASFAPLYMSPFGEHAYRSITVSYCQFLFSRETINEFPITKGLNPIDFSHVNGWSCDRFRTLWDCHSDKLKRVQYRETEDLSHLDLIRKYPSCFRSKCDNFENLVVAGVRVLFERTS